MLLHSFKQREIHALTRIRTGAEGLTCTSRCDWIRYTLHPPWTKGARSRDTRTHLFRRNVESGQWCNSATERDWFNSDWYASRAENEDIRAEKGIRNSRRFVFIQWLILVLGREAASSTSTEPDAFGDWIRAKFYPNWRLGKITGFVMSI